MALDASPDLVHGQPFENNSTRFILAGARKIDIYIFYLDLPRMSPSLFEYNMNPESQQDPPQLKVIGVGKGRTGTASLSVALEKLGFGPCFHTTRYSMPSVWYEKFLQAIKAKGDASPELLHELFHGFGSTVELSSTIAESLYKTYPNAKFILTVTDPAKHAQSWENIIIPFIRTACSIIDTLDNSESEIPNRVTLREKYGHLAETPVGLCRLCKYVSLDDDGQIKKPNILEHNERMIQLIPKEKLLIFDVSAGWKPLVEFLGVPEPNEPFPRINDTKTVLERLASSTWGSA